MLKNRARLAEFSKSNIRHSAKILQCRIIFCIFFCFIKLRKDKFKFAELVGALRKVKPGICIDRICLHRLQKML